MSQTIVAISTPIGLGGVAMIRLSGEEAIAIAEKVFRPVGKKQIHQLAGYQATYGHFLQNGLVIDDGVVLVFRNPKSYTGQDVVELNLHGGIYLADLILDLCLTHGARLAQGGEFTKLAFLNGKLSLPQAEAVMDLINAQSETALKMASTAAEGKLFLTINAMIGRMTDLAGYFGAWFDYPEEDIPQISPQILIQQFGEIAQTLADLLAGYEQGVILREGVVTAIVGKPNVGKSTLMNALVGQERSIVTPLPGTTRDIVAEKVRFGRVVLDLLDTAGIRQTDDLVEQMGVNRSLEKIEKAQLVLVLFDGSAPLTEEDHRIIQAVSGTKVIGILNKEDSKGMPRVDLALLENNFPGLVVISAKNGTGLALLASQIEEKLSLNQINPGAPMLANGRQRDCARRALAFLQELVAQADQNQTPDLLSILLEDALGALLELTGEKAAEKTVDAVFAQFCVGK